MSHTTHTDEKLRRRHFYSRVFEIVCLCSAWFGLLVLTVLLVSIVVKSAGWVDWQFISSYHSRKPENAGILAGLWGSIWVIFFTGLFAIPLGVGAAIYLEEYARPSLLTKAIQTSLSNLAGVPSIVFGFLGVSLFVRMFELVKSGSTLTLFGSIDIPLPFGRTVISGALTMSLLILPVVIVASQEALRSVPGSIRHASLALGATRWQTIRHQVLPSSIPGIVTGIILSTSRALGETAPLLMIGAVTYMSFTPGQIETPADIVTNPSAVAEVPFDQFTTITIQIFSWVNIPGTGFERAAAAGIVVLLALLLALNGMALFIRRRFQRFANW